MFTIKVVGHDNAMEIFEAARVVISRKVDSGNYMVFMQVSDPDDAGRRGLIERHVYAADNAPDGEQRARYVVVENGAGETSQVFRCDSMMAR